MIITMIIINYNNNNNDNNNDNNDNNNDNKNKVAHVYMVRYQQKNCKKNAVPVTVHNSAGSV